MSHGQLTKLCLKPEAVDYVIEALVELGEKKEANIRDLLAAGDRIREAIKKNPRASGGELAAAVGGSLGLKGEALAGFASRMAQWLKDMEGSQFMRPPPVRGEVRDWKRPDPNNPMNKILDVVGPYGGTIRDAMRTDGLDIVNVEGILPTEVLKMAFADSNVGAAMGRTDIVLLSFIDKDPITGKPVIDKKDGKPSVTLGIFSYQHYAGEETELEKATGGVQEVRKAVFTKVKKKSTELVIQQIGKLKGNLSKWGKRLQEDGVNAVGPGLTVTDPSVSVKQTEKSDMHTHFDIDYQMEMSMDEEQQEQYIDRLRGPSVRA